MVPSRIGATTGFTTYAPFVADSAESHDNPMIYEDSFTLEGKPAMNIRRAALGALLFGGCLTSTALAHFGGGLSPAHGGLAAGLLHPLTGLDHLLAMFAVGIWAAQIGGRAQWVVPSAFVGIMLVGAGLGVAHVPLPLVEGGIVGSVILLGLAIALALRVPTLAAAIAVGLFAIFHGHAHGTELAAGLSGLSYGVGFIATTAALHAAGIGFALLLQRNRAATAVRYAGGAIACIGLLLSFGL